MRKAAIVCIGLFVIGGLSAILPHQAYAFNQQITVYATVPQMRVIYINEYGYILNVGGNTTENIQPKVFDQHNNEVPMTAAIQKQYDRFLKLHNYSLEASVIYNLNPVTVNNQPNLQTIIVK